jgi:hypothetical protein
LAVMPHDARAVSYWPAMAESRVAVSSSLNILSTSRRISKRSSRRRRTDHRAVLGPERIPTRSALRRRHTAPIACGLPRQSVEFPGETLRYGKSGTLTDAKRLPLALRREASQRGRRGQPDSYSSPPTRRWPTFLTLAGSDPPLSIAIRSSACCRVKLPSITPRSRIVLLMVGAE